MFDDLGHQDTVLDVTLDLLGDRALLGVLVSTLLGREHDIHARRFTAEDFQVNAGRGKVDGGPIDLIQQQGGHDAVDLQRELGGLDHFETADEGVDDDGETGAVVD